MGRAKFYFLPAVGLSVLVALPPALATASPNNDAIQNLYNIILIPAILIGGLVYVLIFSAVILFRRKPGRRKRAIGNVTEHRALEVAWTLIPAFVLIFVGILSIQVLSQIEYVPAGAKDINVIGHQWFWEFRDPATNNTTRDVLTVQVGQIIHVHTTSVDVIHSFYIPDMGIKIDSFPGRFTHQWFQPTVPGTYIIHCAEFCGLGHGLMKARLVVVPKPSPSSPAPPPTLGHHVQGSALSTVPSPRPVAQVGHGSHAVQISQAPVEVSVQLKDSGCPGGAFCILPSRIDASSGATIRFTVINAGAADHNFTVGEPFNQKIVQLIPPGQSRVLMVNITQSAGAYYWCDVPGHRQSGMQGELWVDVKGPAPSGAPPELPLAQWMMLGAIGVAVASAAVYHVRSTRRTR